jgi:ribonuclease VapC
LLMNSSRIAGAKSKRKPRMSKIVLDASALLAFVNREPGAEKVTAVLGEAMISAVNFCEVVTKLALRNSTSHRVLNELTEFELEVVHFDRSLAEATGLLATRTRELGLSLGDRACLALARREGAIALTADRAWRKVDLGIDIQLIR